MFDLELRRTSQQLLAPVGDRLARVSPDSVTLVGGGIGLGAAAAAGFGWWIVATVLWLANRFLDGVDGVVARSQDRGDDRGGYLDMTVDVVVYASVPLGLAAGLGGTTAWAAVALLLASFYVNTIVWAYLAALLEKQRLGAGHRREITSVTMPRGLIEGAETIVLFTATLLAPLVSRQVTVGLVLAMALLVAVGALERFLRGRWLLA